MSKWSETPTQGLWRAVGLNTKLRKVLHGRNLTVILLTCNKLNAKLRYSIND